MKLYIIPAQRYYEMLMNERIFHILHELKYSNCTNEVVRKKSITILDQLEYVNTQFYILRKINLDL